MFCSLKYVSTNHIAHIRNTRGSNCAVVTTGTKKLPYGEVEIWENNTRNRLGEIGALGLCTRGKCSEGEWTNRHYVRFTKDDLLSVFSSCSLTGVGCYSATRQLN